MEQVKWEFSEEELNLSDFALFLSVMKNQKAHENVLSIIMDETDLRLRKIHVEEVVLNRQGRLGGRREEPPVQYGDAK